ncbi:hypothetical protein GI482_07095 [Bacillus sp. N3536]|nr:hypothetical protein GI482_07095 [Bacillus sp. N3536]
MTNYTILKEEYPKWDEQKQLFFSKVDKNIFKLEAAQGYSSLINYNYWVAESEEGEALGYAWLAIL